MDGLEVSGIRHAFGERVVLDGVDVSVPAGTIVGLLGPNGAGKTTLMRIVFGILEPDVGEIRWHGRPATQADRRRWGYMPQERGLYREMRTVEHLEWLGRVYGMSRPDARRRSTQLLERLGVADRANDAIRDLSGGMAQRVQLAAAMVHDPDLLVLDEPFAGLDPVAAEFLIDVVGEHAAGGRPVVFSSHQLDVVEGLCEAIVMIDRGNVVLDGEVQALRAASPQRALRVDVEVDPEWLTVDGRTPAVKALGIGRSSIALTPGDDAAEMLDRLRAHASVTDFAVAAPSLTDLFLAATGSDAYDPAGNATVGAATGHTAAGDGRSGDGRSGAGDPIDALARSGQ